MAHLPCAAIVCLLGMEIPTTSGLTFSSPEAREAASSRTLTFAKRVAYQRVIEEVYWRHRIWPKENAGPRPPLDAIISQRQIEKKVKAYLCKSQFIADQRGWPISASELQAEMDRIAQNTRRPEVLRELFQALDNDPFVIAACLARPILVERVIADLNLHHDTLAKGLESSRDGAVDLTATKIPRTSYRLPEISLPLDCANNIWTASTTVSATDVRAIHTVVWTGSEMIVWGGYNFNNNQLNTLNTGGKYDPATDSWTPTSTTNAPIGRELHTAVWTGSEMIVWGGYNYPALQLDSGGRYNPATDSWIVTSTATAPVPRQAHSAVWTGSEMIVWGGRNCCTWFNSGGRYNPNADSWTATSTINPPEARWAHTVEWTGSEMIVWGGTNQTIYLNTGATYDPTDNSWAPTTTARSPRGRVGHTSIWSGSEMMVWGGTDSTFHDTNTGGRYNPTADRWSATSTNSAPSPRDSLAAVWTGTEMIVWGGVFCCPAIDFNSGGRYDAGTDSWTATSTASAPLARFYHTAVWTGNEMIVWGGYNYELDIYLNSGGRYCAQSGPTPTPGPITLSASGRKLGRINTVRLTWSGANSTSIDVNRNGTVIATVPNKGAYTDSTGDTGRARYTYKVCEAGTQTCSNDATVRFRH